MLDMEDAKVYNGKQWRGDNGYDGQENQIKCMNKRNECMDSGLDCVSAHALNTTDTQVVLLSQVKECMC